jgi:hypothetical protein
LQISEKLKPPPVVTAIMSKLALVAPKWKIVPTKDIIETGFKEPAKREEVSALDKPPGRRAECWSTSCSHLMCGCFS